MLVQEIASILMSVITSGRMVQASLCGCAIPPASVSHSLAAPSLGSHKGCQRRKKVGVGETDGALQRGRLAQWMGACQSVVSMCMYLYANESEDLINAVISGCVLCQQGKVAVNKPYLNQTVHWMSLFLWGKAKCHRYAAVEQICYLSKSSKSKSPPFKLKY